jgi:hypothetical protein
VEQYYGRPTAGLVMGKHHSRPVFACLPHSG